MKKFLPPFVIVFFTIALNAQECIVWTASIDNNWNDPDNWEEDCNGNFRNGVPTANDTVVFKGDYDDYCDINTNVTVAKLKMASDFSSNVTQGATLTLTVTDSTIISGGSLIQGHTINDLNIAVINGGVFTGSASSHNITVSSLIISSGTFTSTNSQLDIDGSLFSFTGGTFSHASGLTRFVDTDANIVGTPTFNDVHFRSTDNTTHTITVTDATTGITVDGELRLQLSGTSNLNINTGIINVHGPLRGTGTGTGSAGGGNGTIILNGTIDQNINVRSSDADHHLPNLIINKSSGKVTGNVGDRLNIAGKLTIKYGEFQTDGMIIDGESGNEFEIQSGGVYNINSGDDTIAGFTLLDFQTGSYYKYSAAGAQDVWDVDYAGLLLSTSGVKTLLDSVSIADTLAINGTATLDLNTNTCNISLRSLEDNHATDGITEGSQIVYFNGATTGSISGATTLNQVVFANSNGTEILSDNTLTFGELSISSSGILDPGTNGFSVTGNWSNSNGINGFTPDAGSVVEFSGSVQQNIDGPALTEFQDLLINNSNGTTPQVSVLDTIGVVGILDIDDGQLNCDSLLYLKSNGTATAALANLSDNTPEAPPIIHLIHQRFANEEDTSWYLIASPMTDTQLEEWDDDAFISGIDGFDLPLHGFQSLWYYDEAACNWANPIDSSASHNTGMDNSGWLIYGNANTLYQVIGTPAYGTVTIGGLTETTACDPDSGWHLLGNPYAAHVVWDSVNLTNIAGAGGGSAYVIKNDGSGDYVEYDHTAGDVLASGEAFWVQASSNGAIVEFEESDKTLSNTDSYNTVRLDGINQALLSIEMKANATSRIDKTKIALRENASLGYESFNETSKLENLNNLLNIATIVDGNEMNFNSIPTDVQNTYIPIKLYRSFPQGSNDSYELIFNGINEFKNCNKCLRFIDSLSSTSTELTSEGQSLNLSKLDAAEGLFLEVISPVSITTSGLQCGGDDDAFIKVQGDGAGPFTYKWIDPNGDTIRTVSGVMGADSILNGRLGEYSVLVENGGFCGDILAHINVSSSLNQDMITINKSNVSCFGGNNGLATATTSDGNLNKSFIWSNGETNSSAFNLTAGSHSVTITDMISLCSVSKEISISEPEKMIVQLSSTDVTCPGAGNGTISAVTSKTPSDYTFNWSNGSSAFYQTGLLPASYNLTLTETASGCTEIKSINVGTLPAIVVNNVITNVFCQDEGGNNYPIISGGTTPYSFQWSNGGNTNFASNLAQGTYQFTVTDANNCQATSAFNINLDYLSITGSTTNISCNGLSDGSLVASPSGGLSPYTYQWSNGDNAVSADNLSVGNYYLTVTDNSGCEKTSSFVITEPNPVIAAFEIPSDTIAPGQTIQFTNLSQGASSYAWTFGDGNSFLAENPYYTYNTEGTYQVKLISNNGIGTCSDTAITTIYVVQPENQTLYASLFALENSIQIIAKKEWLTLAFEFENPKQIRLQLCNNLGQNISEVYQWNVGHEQRQINYAHLASGSYILTIDTGEGMVAKRFVKP